MAEGHFSLESKENSSIIERQVLIPKDSRRNMDNPTIDYPCNRSYCLIGMDEQQRRNAIRDCLGKMDYRVAFSHRSTRGKYVSLNVETVVITESARDQIYDAFSRHTAITRVI